MSVWARHRARHMPRRWLAILTHGARRRSHDPPRRRAATRRCLILRRQDRRRLAAASLASLLPEPAQAASSCGCARLAQSADCRRANGRDASRTAGRVSPQPRTDSAFWAKTCWSGEKTAMPPRPLLLPRRQQRRTAAAAPPVMPPVAPARTSGGLLAYPSLDAVYRPETRQEVRFPVEEQCLPPWRPPRMGGRAHAGIRRAARVQHARPPQLIARS